MSLKILIVGKKEAVANSEEVRFYHELSKGKGAIIHTVFSEMDQDPVTFSAVSSNLTSRGGQLSGELARANRHETVDRNLLPDGKMMKDRLRIVKVELEDGQIIEDLGLPPHQLLIAGHTWQPENR